MIVPKNETSTRKSSDRASKTKMLHSIPDFEGALENFSAEIEPLHFLPPISEYVFPKKFHSLLYFHHSKYIGRI